MASKPRSNYCCVFGCKRNSSMDGVHLTKIPKRQFNIWAEKIPRKSGNALKEGCTYFVCDAHFPENSFIKEDKLLINGEVVYKPCKVRLMPGTIPTIFDECEQTTNQVPSKTKTVVKKNIVKNTKKKGKIIDNKPKVKVLKYEDLFTIENGWSIITSQKESFIVFYFLDNDFVSDRKIIIFKNLEYQVKIGYIDIKFEDFMSTITTYEEFEKLFKIVKHMIICPTSSSLSTAKTTKCMGFKTRKINDYCSNCCYYYRIKRSNEIRKQKYEPKRKRRLSKEVDDDLTKEVASLNNELEELREQCANITEDALDDAMDKHNIPDELRDTIEDCVLTARKKGNGKLNTKEWISKCALLKKRSKEAYDFLRRECSNTLPLPSSRNAANSK